MCTELEAKRAVLDALNEIDDTGETVISRAVHEHITNKGNQIVSKLTMRFGIAFVALIVSSAGTWYSLYYQVQKNTSDISEVTVDVEQGGRYTREDAAVRDAEIQRQFAEQNEKILQLRQDMTTALEDTRSGIRRIENILLSR